MTGEPSASTVSTRDVRYSFLTTNYGKADVLERGITSMLAALPADGELIVVDGGSGGKSVSLLRNLARTDDRLRVIEAQTNTGEGRQLAFERALGEVVVQQLDTDRVYDPALGTVVETFEELDRGHENLVLATLDSLYLSRPAPIRAVGGYPPLARVDERVLVERLCRHPDVTFRVLPVAVSRELPTADTATARRRARKWRRTARDLLRVGFSPGTLLRYNHRRFPLPKALLADLLCLFGALDARSVDPIAVERDVPRGPAVVESWQAICTHHPDFFPDGESAILSPADIPTSLPDDAWVPLGADRPDDSPSTVEHE